LLLVAALNLITNPQRHAGRDYPLSHKCVVTLLPARIYSIVKVRGLRHGCYHFAHAKDSSTSNVATKPTAVTQPKCAHALTVTASKCRQEQQRIYRGEPAGINADERKRFLIADLLNYNQQHA
jgi:uncharacterized protein (UPF0179 family)